MELCFLVNNDSFHSCTAFNPVAETDTAEGRVKERGRVVLLDKAALSMCSSVMKCTVSPTTQGLITADIYFAVSLHP